MSTSSIQPELTSLETKLSEEIANDRKQLDFLQKRISKNETLLRAVRGALSSSGGPSVDSNGQASKAEFIREALQRVTKSPFTVGDVEAELKRINPEVQIRSDRVRAILWAFAEKTREIKRVAKGNNKQPAEYEKLQNQSNRHIAAVREPMVLTSEPETMQQRIVSLLKSAPGPMTARDLTKKYESLNWPPAPNGNLYLTLLQCAYYMGKTGKLVNTRGKYSLPV